MATVQTLDKIRVTLEKHLGKTIVLKANKGRKQIVTKVGVLENVYPSVFVVKLDGTSNGNQIDSKCKITNLQKSRRQFKRKLKLYLLNRCNFFLSP